jgi:hypothetical protein
VIEVKGKRATRYMHMYGKNPAWAEYLRTFGESGTVKIKTDTTPKLHDRRVQCMLVGYAENHGLPKYEQCKGAPTCKIIPIYKPKRTS